MHALTRLTVPALALTIYGGLFSCNLVSGAEPFSKGVLRGLKFRKVEYSVPPSKGCGQSHFFSVGVEVSRKMPCILGKQQNVLTGALYSRKAWVFIGISGDVPSPTQKTNQKTYSPLNTLHKRLKYFRARICARSKPLCGPRGALCR